MIEPNLFGEMNGTQRSSTANTSAYRNVATAVHCRLMAVGGDSEEIIDVTDK